MGLEKEARQVNQIFFNFKNGEYRDHNMHKKYYTEDKIGIADGWVIYQLGDAVTSVLPLGRHASTRPILKQRYPRQHKSSTQSQLNRPTTH